MSRGCKNEALGPDYLVDGLEEEGSVIDINYCDVCNINSLHDDRSIEVSIDGSVDIDDEEQLDKQSNEQLDKQLDKQSLLGLSNIY